MDTGYTVFILNEFIKMPESTSLIEEQEPFIIFASIKPFPHPYWIDRRNQTEASTSRGQLCQSLYAPHSQCYC